VIYDFYYDIDIWTVRNVPRGAWMAFMKWTFSLCCSCRCCICQVFISWLYIVCCATCAIVDTYCSEEYSQTDYSFIIIIVSVEVYFCNNTINSAFAWLLTTSEAFLACYQISIIYAAHAIFVYGSSTQKLCWFVSIILWKFFLMGVCIVLMEYSWIEILIQIFLTCNLAFFPFVGCEDYSNATLL
jgi:hypothetical protein